MNFEYKEIDGEGLSVLDSISTANNFNKWMYDTIAPHCKGDILEIGSGVGNISQYLIKNNSQVCLSDIRENYRNIIKRKFNLNDEKVFELDIVNPNFTTDYSHLLGRFDSIICLNVIEHVLNDNLAIENIMKLLKPDGNSIILVPAFQNLYNGIDKTLEHYRRYNKKTLTNLASKHGSIEKTFYFNTIGILAWIIGGRLLGNKTIEENKMGLFDFFVPIHKLIDKLFCNKIGLSVICVIKKQ